MRLPFAILGCSYLVAFVACNASGGNLNDIAPGTGPGETPGTGTGGMTAVNWDPNATQRDPSDTRDLATREKQCDSAGNCTCLRMAMIGTLESAAVQKDTKPFVDWLNDKSGGTATVTMVTGKPTLDEAFLSQYDILLIANLGTSSGSSFWTFSDGEKAAVEKWVRETGGGIINITGFFSTGGEPAASSQLIQFSGISYSSVTAAPKEGEYLPLTYKEGTVDVKRCLQTTNNTVDQAFITTPVHFAPQQDNGANMTKLTKELNYVGAFYGWGVNAPTGATVLATDPNAGSHPNMAVAMEVDKKGRIFAFADEWVVFKNQWVAVGTPTNAQQDQYNPCYVMPSGDQAGFLLGVETLYQTKQFWYNAINWVAPPNACGFVIKDEGVVVY